MRKINNWSELKGIQNKNAEGENTEPRTLRFIPTLKPWILMGCCGNSVFLEHSRGSLYTVPGKFSGDTYMLFWILKFATCIGRFKLYFQMYFLCIYVLWVILFKNSDINIYIKETASLSKWRGELKTVATNLYRSQDVITVGYIGKYLCPVVSVF